MAGTLAVEGLIFAAGLAGYLRATRARYRAGSWGLWALATLLALIHLGNAFGPPPPGVTAIAWVGQMQWLIVAWAYWLDRHCGPR